MGPINSLDPPAGALSNPSNGKEAVSVLDWCQGSVKSSSTHPDARYKMQDATLNDCLASTCGANQPSSTIWLRCARYHPSHCAAESPHIPEAFTGAQCEEWHLSRRRLNALLNALRSGSQPKIPRGEGDEHR